MKIFKYRNFHQWAKSENLSDHVLKPVISELLKGLFEANLGGGLYKKRVACQQRGKRSGYRTLIAYQQANRAIFMYGFAKNERANINQKEKDLYKKLGRRAAEFLLI